MSKITINLLQAELIPVKPLWSLSRVVIIWAVSLIVMLGWMFISEKEVEKQERLLSFETNKQKQNSELQTALEKKVAKNKANPVFEEQLATMKLLLVNKRALHRQLTDSTSTYSAGFSVAMSELAKLHNSNVSLQHISITHNNMSFSGVARTPDAVPTWLAAFEESTFLAGQSFRHFSLLETDDNFTEFTVSSFKGGKEKRGSDETSME